MYEQNFGTGQRWMPAIIREVTGPVSFLMKLPDGRLVRRHQDILRCHDTNGARASSGTCDSEDVVPEIPD